MSHAYTIADTDLVISHHGPVYAITRMRDLAPEDKPREKLIKSGPEVLSTSELLEVVLGSGTKKEDVRTMSRRMLREYGEHTIAHERHVTRLRDELGVPETKACQIVACFELGRRFFHQGTGRAITIRTPEQVYEHTKAMATLTREHLRGLYLNNHYRLIHDEIISIGSLTSHVVHPREIFRPAIEYAASAVVLVHNHPSGSKEPSTADHDITKQLVDAGSMLGIELLDHLIIGSAGYTCILSNKAL